MNIFQKADYFLISRIFQPIVDWSQKQPLWWMLQTAHLTTLLFLMRASARFPDAGLVNLQNISGLIVAFAMYAATKMPGGQEIWASSLFVRTLMLWGFCIDLILLFLVPPSFLGMASTAYSLSLCAHVYFACCKPPKPKVQKTKLAYQ